MRNMTLSGGETLERTRSSMIVRFPGNRMLLSTSALCGGARDDLQAVFNYCDCPRAGVACEMRGTTMAAHLADIAVELGLDPTRCTGMSTAANMDNAAIHHLEREGISVTAIVTAGVEFNACRAGDAPTLHECGGTVDEYRPGTINIILLVGAALTQGCMARLLCVATSAKAAVLRELDIHSRDSGLPATGTTTDGAVIVCDPAADIKLSEGGENFLLGALVAQAVAAAIREALLYHSGASPLSRRNLFTRLEPKGLSRDTLRAHYMATYPDTEKFDAVCNKMATDGYIASRSALIAFVLDELAFGLVPPQEAACLCHEIISLMCTHYNMPAPEMAGFSQDSDETQRSIIRCLMDTACGWIAE